MIVQTSEVQSGARVLNLAYNSIHGKLLPGTLLQEKSLILLSFTLNFCLIIITFQGCGKISLQIPPLLS